MKNKTTLIKIYPVTQVTRILIEGAAGNGSLFLKIFKINNSDKIKMKKIIWVTALFSLLFATAKAQDIKEIDGLYYKNGKLYSGEYVTRFDNGQLKMTMKIAEGKKEGKIKIYFENGLLHEIRSYKNNQMHNKWVMYNDHNIKISVARYKNGVKHGKWFIWNDYGNLLYQLEYNQGEKSGTWKNYNEKGEVVNERKY
jgi:antitoxin component YwqK of YwqJK toxin-antitoxin module